MIALLAGRHGHFQTESGYHTDQWFDLDRLFADRARLRPFAAELARRLDLHHIDALCGPATGGAMLAEMIAAELSLKAFVAERFARADVAGFFPVRYRVPPAQRAKLRNRRVVLVDDAINAGSAVRGAHADLLACGATPVALGALFIFGDAAVHFAAEHDLALAAIARRPANLWPPTACPLCRAGQALEEIPAG